MIFKIKIAFLNMLHGVVVYGVQKFLKTCFIANLKKLQ